MENVETKQDDNGLYLAKQSMLLMVFYIFILFTTNI